MVRAGLRSCVTFLPPPGPGGLLRRRILDNRVRPGSGSGGEEALDGLIGARFVAGRPGEDGQDGGDGHGVKIEGWFRRGQRHRWIDLATQAEPVDQGLKNCAYAIPVQWRAGLAAVFLER